MYATRTNTKYTEFIRGYYQEPLKNVTTPSQSPDNGFNHFNSYSFPLKSQHSIVEIGDGDGSGGDNENIVVGGEDNLIENAEPSRDHPTRIDLTSQYNHSNFSFNITPSLIGGKTKYGDIFDSDQSPALRLKLLREAERFGGKTKVFSDSDLVLLHHKVSQSYQLLSPRNLSAAPASRRSNTDSKKRSSGSKKIVTDPSRDQPEDVDNPGDPSQPADDPGVEDADNKNIDLESVILHPLDNNNIDHLVSKHIFKHRGEENRGISDLESDLQRLQDETLRVLSRTRTRSTSTPKLEDLAPLISAAAVTATSIRGGGGGEGGPGSGFNHVSYQEILKAEHVALRRELLSNIREISRATFYEDLYTGRSREGPSPADREEKPGGEKEKTGVPGGGEEGKMRPDSAKRTDSAFHLNLHPGTADPAERVSLWLNSQDPRNRVSQEGEGPPPVEPTGPEAEDGKSGRRSASAEKKAASILPESDNSPPLHASLFHDSIWEEENAHVEGEPLNDGGKVEEVHAVLSQQNSVQNDQPFVLASSAVASASAEAAATPAGRTASESLLDSSPLVINNNIVINNYNENERVETAQVHETPEQEESIHDNPPESPPPQEQDEQEEEEENEVEEILEEDHDPIIEEENVIVEPDFVAVADNDNELIDEPPPQIETVEEEVEVVEETGSEILPRYSIPHADTIVDETVVEEEVTEEEHHEEDDVVEEEHPQEEEEDVDLQVEEEDAEEHQDDIEEEEDAQIDEDNYIIDDEEVAQEEPPSPNEEEDDVVVVEEVDEEQIVIVDGEEDVIDGDGDENEEEVLKSPTIPSSSVSELDNVNPPPPPTPPQVDQFSKVMSRTVVASQVVDQTFTKYSQLYRTPQQSVADVIVHNGSNSASPPPSNSRLATESRVKGLPTTVNIIPQTTRESFPPRIYQPKMNYRSRVGRKLGSKVVATAISNRFSANSAAVPLAPPPPPPVTFNVSSGSGNYDSSRHPTTNSRSPLTNISTSISNSGSSMETKFSKVNDPPRKYHVIQVDGPSYTKNPKGRGKVPGIIRRHNMDQWVAKRLYFFINGDEHFPKMEYRFRPKKDVKNLDTLCDILSKKLNLDRGVRYIFTIDGHHIERLEDLRHDHSYVVSSTKKFKAMNYGFSGGGDSMDKSQQTDNNNGETRSRRPPSAPSQRKPPTIRIRRERSLNGVMWGSPQQLTSDSANTTGELGQPVTTTTTGTNAPRRSRKRQSQQQLQKEKYTQATGQEGQYTQTTLSQPLQSTVVNNNHIDSGNHLKVDERSRHHRSHSNDSNKGGRGSTDNMPYSPEAERFMRAAIDKSRPVERQVIRIINGNDPTVQSQVLLNTKTAQPWDELVRDLGMAVKLPKKRDCQMETISGRRIHSYSQLRSELNAGNHAFYVYSGREDIIELGSLPSLTLQHHVQQQQRRVSQPQTKHQYGYSDYALPAVHHNNNNFNSHQNQNQIQKASKSTSMIIPPSHDYSTSNENIPTINRKSSMKALSSTNLATKTSAVMHNHNNNNRLSTGNLNNNNNNSTYLSTSSTHVKESHSTESSKSNPSLSSSQQQQQLQKQTLQQPRNRSTRRRRSEASVYLATRSRSVSP